MNKDILEGKWKQLRGKAKETWGKLTDDDLDRIEGKSDQLIGLLQQRYGYARDRAQEELNRFLAAAPDSADREAMTRERPGARH
ncbi:MAG TPA: CsbD family protein [Methylomirabilota bacterium]|jgi:uncharacterized protein YjbJ (UPF0337 family)|nr:CsbD family protein [Methylomirabilota bacterium]